MTDNTETAILAGGCFWGMQEMLRKYDGCWQYPIASEQHVVLDTAQPLKALVNQVLERIDVMRRPGA